MPATLNDGSGNRLDKEGNPIKPPADHAGLGRQLSRRLPSSSPDWYGQLGIKVTHPGARRRPRLIDIDAPARSRRRGYKADYDMIMWGWVGNLGPERPPRGLHAATRSAARRDSLYCNPHTTSCTTSRTAAPTPTSARRSSTRCSRSFYDEAPYHILYYDANLDAYRTDRVRGLAEPAGNGTPLFTYWNARLHAADGGRGGRVRSRRRAARATAASARGACHAGDRRERASTAASSTPLIIGDRGGRRRHRRRARRCSPGVAGTAARRRSERDDAPRVDQRST